MMNIANILTVSRIFAIPLILSIYYMSDSRLLLAGIFVLAGLTDWLDGYAARYTKQITPLGSFLDPVADKLLVVTVLGVLMAHYHTRWLTIPSILIICRELFASALREWVAKQDHTITVSWAAKCKTALQMFALTLLLYAGSMDNWFFNVGYACLLLSMVFSFYSLVNYIKSAWPVLTFGIKNE